MIKKNTNKIKKSAPENLQWKYFYFGIFLVPFVVNPFASQPYEIPKISWIMMFAAIYLMLASILLLKGKINISFNKPLLVVIGFWIFAFALSTLLSVSPVESFWGSFERMQGTLSMLYFLIHFLICLKLLKHEKEQNIFLWLIMVVGSVLSIHAILQWAQIAPDFFGSVEAASGRGYATVGQPNLLGQWLVAPFFASLILFMNAGKNIKKRIIGLLFFILILAGVATTLNRATFAGIIIAAGLYFIYEKQISRSKTIVLFASLIAIGLVAISLFGGNLRSANTRMILWENTVPLIIQNPIAGSGPETFYQTFQTVLPKEIYQYETLYNMPDRVHNETLQVAHDLGVTGLVLYLINLVFIGWVYFKKKAQSAPAKIAFFSLIAVTVSLQFSFSSASNLIINLALWAVLLNATLRFKPLRLRANIPARIFTFAVCAVFAVFSFTHSYSLNRADSMMAEGVNAFFGDYQKAANIFDDMLKTAPHYRHLHYSVIHFLAMKQKLVENEDVQKQVRDYLDELKTITNGGFHYHLAEAKTANALNDYQTAQTHFESAAALAPDFPLIYQNWGDSAFENGNYESAIKAYEKLKSLAPPYWATPHENATFEESEKHRIFKKTHALFYMAMGKLAFCYDIGGQKDKSLEIGEKIFGKEDLLFKPSFQ